MVKKILLGIVVTVAVVLVGGYLFRDSLGMLLIASQIKPGYEFAVELAPPAPDYDDTSNWAALPHKVDASDDRPTGVDFPYATEVDVFFLHPTSYTGKANWNQPLDDQGANWIVDERILRHQASVFNTCCEVFAPRYRQATIYSFMDEGANGAQALDLAYSDAERAFDHFVNVFNRDRPFILAGHSQGTSHAARLLRERIAGTPLQERLVAAYLIGFSVTDSQLGGVPVCESASQTGCVVAWNAVDAGEPGIFPGTDLVCVNPLSWTTDGAPAGSDLNEGGIGYPSWGPVDGEDATAMPLEPGVADAQCVSSNLAVTELRSSGFPSRMPGGSMHIYDYSLFHMNIRNNALARVNAFLAR